MLGAAGRSNISWSNIDYYRSKYGHCNFLCLQTFFSLMVITFLALEPFSLISFHKLLIRTVRSYSELWEVVEASLLKVSEDERGNVWREDREVTSFCQLAKFFLHLLGESFHPVLKFSLMGWKKTAVHDGNHND